MDSVWYIAMLIVGGMGSIAGAIFGTVFFEVLFELTVTYGTSIGELLPFEFGKAATASVKDLAFAFVIMLFLIYEPRGLNHRWQAFKNYYKFYPFKQ